MANPGHLTAEHLDFLENVLGIRSFIQPLSQPASPSSSLEAVMESDPHADTRVQVSGSTPACKIVALFPLGAADFPLRAEMGNLVGKMIQAMKLKPSEVLSVEWVIEDPQNISDLPATVDDAISKAVQLRRPVLVFGYAPGFLDSTAQRGEWWDLRGAQSIGTFSAGELLHSPAKKKEAWAHLQKMMKLIASN